VSDHRELIVLVHGFGSMRLIMWPLACLLRAGGFRVRQWSYASLFAPIDDHAKRFFEFLEQLATEESRFHIVAHSMGSIIVQSALNRGYFPNLGRIVFLAPPNRGSPVARVAALIFGQILAPTRELSDALESYVNKLERKLKNDVGVIAARFDLLVPISNTHLANESAHIVINATHNSLLVSTTVSKLTARFLATGAFEESLLAGQEELP